MYKITGLAAAFLLLTSTISAQDDLLKELEKSAGTKNDVAIATFKSTRLINFHTIETVGKRTLDFRISHRFGEVNSGWYGFYGMDDGASIKLALEYSFDGRLMFGIGRSSYNKVCDGFVKYRLLRQTVNNKMPISLTLFSSMYYTLLKDVEIAPGTEKYQHTSDRLSYCNQIIIGRKFSEAFSFQIAPTMVHFNLVEKVSDKNDIYAMCFATRFKISKSMALTAEYGLRLNKYYDADETGHKYYDSAGIGFDLETGGHVFQLNISNSSPLTENEFIPYTKSSWKEWEIRLGFNISRVFKV